MFSFFLLFAKIHIYHNYFSRCIIKEAFPGNKLGVINFSTESVP